MVQIKRPRDLSLATERVADVDTAFCCAMPMISAAIKLEHQLEAAYLDVETNNRSVAPVFQHGAAISIQMPNMSHGDAIEAERERAQA